MAKRRMRGRTRGRRNRANGNRARGPRLADRPDGNVVGRLLLGAVDGVEVIAVGALQLTRDVTVTTVSGVASIGAEAVSAVMQGARGIVSVTSQMIGDVAGAAQGTFRTTLENARRSGRGHARSASRGAVLAASDTFGSATPSASGRAASRARRRTSRLRLAPHPARPSEAA
jgi:hypothetical protein